MYSVKGIDLCSRSSKIGCACVASFFAICILVLIFAAPALLFLLLLYLPFAFIGVEALRAFKESIGRTLEIDGQQVLLRRGGHQIWALEWKAVTAVCRHGNLYLDFVGGGGDPFRVPIVNLGKPVTESLLEYVAPDVPYELVQMEFMSNVRIRLPKPLAWILAVGGAAAFIWGMVGIVLASAALRASRLGDSPPPELGELLWQSLAIVVGLILGWQGLKALQPDRKRSQIVPGQLGKRLSGYLATAENDRETAEALEWRALESDRSFRSARTIIFVCLSFWSAMFLGVILMAVRDPKTSFLAWPYAGIVALHLWAAFTILRYEDPRNWTVHTSGSETWIEGKHGTYKATSRKAQGAQVLEFSLDGKRRLLDTKRFLVQKSQIKSTKTRILE